MRVSKYKVGHSASALVSAAIDADRDAIEQALFDVVETSLEYLVTNRGGVEGASKVSATELFAEKLSDLVESYM